VKLQNFGLSRLYFFVAIVAIVTMFAIVTMVTIVEVVTMLANVTIAVKLAIVVIVTIVSFDKYNPCSGVVIKVYILARHFVPGYS
jgi:hypothetical protein